MIIEIPNENSIIKWRNNDKGEWKVAEISDLIKAYERPQGDLISREALLNAMEEERQYLLARGQTGAEHILVHHCLPLIDNAPTVSLQDIYQEGHYDGHLEGYTKAINEDRPQGEWIPVSERLPEESLNSVIGWDSYRERCVFVQYIDGYFQITGSAESFNIVAWQPLPDPYKEGGKE